MRHGALGFMAAMMWAVVMSPGTARADEKVRIAIVEKATQIVLEGEELEAGGHRPADGKIVLKQEKDSITLNGKKVNLSDGLLFKSRGLVSVGGKPVRGEIEVRLDAGKLTAINIVLLEAYLAAVLGSEMPASFPEEALKAQAVAARTYAIQKKLLTWGKPYHLAATVLDQVYGGARAEDPRTRAAVYATQGEVLVFKREAIEAYFHASCGGATETGFDALGADKPYLQSVSCECGKARDSRWRYVLSAADLKRIWSGATGLEILERTASGRVKMLRLTGSSPREISGVEFRRTVGYGKVQSLAFDVKANKGEFTLSGRGAGHAAGMCQWGAKAYADQGWRYRSILERYYPGARIERMY